MPLKGLSFDEIVKKEVAAGKPQKQAVAIAYSQTGKGNSNDLSAMQRYDSMGSRVARGTERYASKKNEDEASEEEHEIQKEELERKKQNSWKKATSLKIGDIITDEEGSADVKVTKVEKSKDGGVVFTAGGQTYAYDRGEEVFVK